MSRFLTNLMKPYSDIRYTIFAVVLGVIFYSLGEYFTDREVMLGNYGNLHVRIDLALSIMLAVLFPIFITGVIYKGILFGRGEITDKRSFLGWLGGIIATIISGASCCGPTLAIYFSLIPLMTWLPYDGLEVKVIAIIVLIWSTLRLYRDLDTCRAKKR